MSDITSIPLPKVAFIDPRTGLISRPWYRFLLNLFMLTGSGTSVVTAVDLAVSPEPQPVPTDAFPDTQLAAMMARFDEALSALQASRVQPAYSEPLSIDPTAYGTPAQQVVGTLGVQDADAVQIGGGTASLSTLEITDDEGLDLENQTDGAGSDIGTLNNAPAATDPDFWAPIVLNGATYLFPAWLKP